jgi:hypothetical protein
MNENHASHYALTFGGCADQPTYLASSLAHFSTVDFAYSIFLEKPKYL